MTASVQLTTGTDGMGAGAPGLLIREFQQRNTCVVHVTGELDLATSDQLVSASTGGHHPKMVIDLGGVTFMDGSGYGSLIACRRIIEGEGRSLAIIGQSGQPARVCKLIAEFENSRPDFQHHRSDPIRS